MSDEQTLTDEQISALVSMSQEIVRFVDAVGVIFGRANRWLDGLNWGQDDMKVIKKMIRRERYLRRYRRRGERMRRK